ncbi:hypothetical protein Ssi03_12550 [Sphaerisporangium siamense]|nr:hypothetical protein Ssi03_12550 [Sphaerisporangium siamense]
MIWMSLRFLGAFGGTAGIRDTGRCSTCATGPEAADVVTTAAAAGPAPVTPVRINATNIGMVRFAAIQHSPMGVFPAVGDIARKPSEMSTQPFYAPKRDVRRPAHRFCATIALPCPLP